MYIAKPIQKGKVAGLDGSDQSTDVVDLASATGAQLLNAQDFGLFGNPDGAKGAIAGIPSAMEVQSPGKLRTENISGQGVLHPTAQTDAPKANPFPAARTTVRTFPSTIKE